MSNLPRQGSYIRHGIRRRDKCLTTVPRSFWLKSVSQVTRISLVSAVTLACLSFVFAPGLCFLLLIPFFLEFLFMLSLVTAVLKELGQHLSLGSVKTCKIHFLGLRSPNMTHFLILIHKESIFCTLSKPINNIEPWGILPAKQIHP